jgi:hypothetical protein
MCKVVELYTSGIKSESHHCIIYNDVFLYEEQLSSAYGSIIAIPILFGAFKSADVCRISHNSALILEYPADLELKAALHKDSQRPGF